VRFGALFVKRPRVRKGPKWIVVQTPEQWARMYKYAMKGVDLEREEKSAMMHSRDTAAAAVRRTKKAPRAH
jgi:truncated hemoglobin YjbI